MPGQPISQSDIEKYWEIFCYRSNNSTKITGEQAFVVLKQSNLPDDKLAKIWDLSDIDRDGNLDFEEFCVAMRVIYDVMNGEYPDVPKVLPDFLVPESKIHLVAANSALQKGGETFEQVDVEDDTPGLKDGFDWYMPPKDKSRYEGMYQANAGAHGQLAFDALEELYNSIDVPDTDIANAWKLVNPKGAPTVGKDQALIFLHILNNRHEGFRIPRTVPASLRSSFEKNQISYDLDSVPPQRKGAPDLNTYTGKKEAFGESYLTRMGLGGRSTYSHSGTDFGVTKDEDWEEVRLKKELALLETKIKDAEEESTRRRERGRFGSRGTSAALVKRELEQMLDYKRRELRDLDEGGGDTEQGKSLQGISEDLNVIREQVEGLESHLKNREQVLEGLLIQIEDEKAKK